MIFRKWLKKRYSRLRFERLEVRRVLATFFVDEAFDFSGGLCAPDNSAANSGCSIRSAIESAAASPGADTIFVPAGSYLLDSNLGALEINDSLGVNELTIAAEPNSSGPVVVSANQSSRVFNILSAPTTAVTFEGLTIRDGFASDARGGGGVYSTADLRVVNSIFEANETQIYFESNMPVRVDGGAIQSLGPLTISGSLFSANFADGSGGAIDFAPTDAGTSLAITASDFVSNSASIAGGAISKQGVLEAAGLVSITNSQMNGNASGVSGGGVYAANATLNVSNSNFTENVAGTSGGDAAAGGGLWFAASDESQTFGLVGGQFVSNEATGQGGGAFFADADGTISGTSFLLNMANTDGPGASPLMVGGGAFASRGNNRVPAVDASNVLIDQNTAGFGGGIALTSANLNLIDSTVTNNTATNSAEGGGAIGAFGVVTNPATVAIESSTIEGNSTPGIGGGLLLVDMNLTIRDTNILRNTASSDRGGGVGVLGNQLEPTITIETSVIDGNSAFNHGGGIFIGSDVLGPSFSATTTILNTTIANNSVVDSSTGLGGGLFAPGPLDITNSSVHSNNAASAGGIFFGTGLNANSGSLNVFNTEISLNDASQAGGGIFIEPAIGPDIDATFTNSRILQNKATGQGGGLRSSGMPLVFSGGEVSNNSTDQGIESDGGGLSVAGDLSISGTRFDSNSARDVGGALAHVGGQLQIDRATFLQNTAGESGGALYLQPDNLSVRQSTFDRNSAALQGGAAVLLSGIGTIENSTFSANVATDVSSGSGGAIAVDLASLNVSHSTLTLNDAAMGGGVFAGISGNVSVANSIIAGNSAGSSGPDVAGDYTSLDGNLIGDVGAATGFTGPADQVGNASNPIDPLLGPLVLQNPSDLTPTHALLSGSPAIDAAGTGVVLQIDQRGAARPSDGDGDRNFLADIGALEAATIVLLDIGNRVFADMDNNGLFGGSDFGLADVVLQLYEDTDRSGDLDLSIDNFVTSTVSLGDGSYSFQFLPPGDYMIVIADSNYLLPDSPLEAYRTSTGNDPAPDPDLDPTDGDDNGTEILGIGVVTAAFTLTVDGELADDGDSNPNTNLAIDFGFAPTLHLNTDSASVFLGASVDVDVLFNDETTVAAGIQVLSVTQPSLGLGTVSVNPNGSLKFTTIPSVGIGSDSFTYTATDGTTTLTTTVFVDVQDNPADGPAVAVDDGVVTDEDVPLLIEAAELISNDSPEIFAGSPVLPVIISSVDLIAGVTVGSVTLNEDNSVTYTPPSDFFGTDQFTYTLANGLLPATVLVTVRSVNDAPVASKDSFNIIGSGSSAAFNVLNNDLPGPANEAVQTIRIHSIVSPPSLGTAVISESNDSIIYLTSSALGTDSFSYTVIDSDGLISSPVTVTILIDSTLQITGILTCDLNGNLVNDSNEALVNREVFLDLNGNRTFDEEETLVTTDSNGRYRFPLSEGGIYDVVTIVPSGCTTITPFPSTVRTAGVGNLARSLAVANLDGDADLDLVVVSDLDGRVTNLHNNDGQLTVAPRITIGGRPQSIAVWQPGNASIPATTAIADVGTTEDGGRIVRIGQDQAIIPVPGGPFKVLLEDFDGDDKPEIIFSDYRNSSLRLIRGGSTEIINLTSEVGADVIGAAFGDFDADGDIDIAVAGDQFSVSGAGGVRLLLGDGVGGFTNSQVIGFSGGVVDIASANLDQTAGDEILVLSSSGMLRTLAFDGLALREVSSTPIESGAASFLVGNFNGDDFLDVAIASTVKRTRGDESDRTNVEGKLEFLVGTTSRTFVPFATTFSVDSPSDMVAVDLDGDQIDELAVTNLFQEVSGPKGPQFVFPSTVTVFKLNVAVLPVTVVSGQPAEADFVFASADPEILLDVNRDNQLAPLDALIVMNALNHAGEGEPSGYRPRYDTDVNRDGRTTPVDALMIINRLNRMSPANGEGEASLLMASDSAGSVPWTDEAERRRRAQRANAVDELWATEFDLFN